MILMNLESRTRATLFRLAAIWFGTLVALLLARLLLVRVNDPRHVSLLRAYQAQRLYFETDPTLGVVRRRNLDFRYRFREHPTGYVHFVSNNQGLRRFGPTRYERDPKLKRVLVLGDSHFDGFVNEHENFTYLLEASLKSRGAPHPAEVLNASLGSYSPLQSFLWYERTGHKFHPEIILFTFYLGNDLSDLMTPGARPTLDVGKDGRQWKVRPPDTLRLGASGIGRLERLHLRLVSEGVLYPLVYSLVGSYPGWFPPQGQAASICGGCLGQSLGQIRWSKTGPVDEALSVFTLILERFETLAAERRARLILLLLPTRLEVEPARDSQRIAAVRRLLSLTSEDLAFETSLRRALKRIAVRQGVAVIDLFDPLSQSSGPTYWDSDWHLNVQGHRVVAECLLDRLFPLEPPAARSPW